MELNVEKQSNDSGNATFRKSSNVAANRKYRRHSPSGSSLSGDSPKHDRGTNPTSKEDAYGKRITDDRERKVSDRSELEKDSGRTDPYRSSDRHSRRLVDRRDDGSRYSRYTNEGDREYRHSSGRESRRGAHPDHTREERYDGSGYRSKDKEGESLYEERHKQKGNNMQNERSGSGRRRSYSKYEEKESDIREEKREKSSGDSRVERTRIREESRGHRHDSSSRTNDSHDTYKSDQKDSEGQNGSTGERQNDDLRRKSPPKKSKFSSLADKEQLLTLKQAVDFSDKTIAGEANGTETAGDLNAAKFAAIRAAELVKKNLSGVGCGVWTTEQKKKLLWGNKKSTTTDEPGRRWDASLFGDRERQEKFNKLMGVKGDVKMEQKSDTQNAEKQKELQLDLEKQYTAGLRRRDGRTVGLGL